VVKFTVAVKFCVHHSPNEFKLALEFLTRFVYEPVGVIEVALLAVRSVLTEIALVVEVTIFV
jgi:hypothetical protein